MLYGRPEGAFESSWNNKDSAGTVGLGNRVVSESQTWQATAVMAVCPRLFTCLVTLEQRLVSYYLQLAFVTLKHFSGLILSLHSLFSQCILTPRSGVIYVITEREEAQSSGIGNQVSEVDVCFLYT